MLASKQIVVCGVGALGSNLVDLLVRQGIAKISVIDMDRVESHNVNTQLYGDADVGALKVAALKNRLFRDVGVEIKTESKELTAANVQKFLKGADLVIDTFDNRKSRLIVHEHCERTEHGIKRRIPCLHGGMFEGYGEAVWGSDYTVPQDAPVDAKDVCDYPLARNLVMLTVTIMAEEVIDFCTAKIPRKGSWSITLKDLAVRKYR